MSGTVTPSVLPLSALPAAVAVGSTDVLLVLQLDTTQTPPVYIPRQLPMSVILSAAQVTAEQLNAILAVSMQALPTSLPSAPNQAWLNGGALSLS